MVEILKNVYGRQLGLDKDSNLVIGGTKLVIGHDTKLDQIIDLLSLAAANSSIPGVVGDGTTDDSDAFAAAVTATSVAGGTLQIAVPLLINANQTIASNVQLVFIGRGKIKPASGKTITINGAITAGAWQIFDTSAGGTIAGSIRNDRVYAEWFGAVADGTTDSTTAINHALVLAHAASDIPVQLLAGTYVVSDTLVATGLSFTRPNISGVNKKQTILDFSTSPASTVCIKVKGGSGQSTGDSIRDLTLNGHSTAIALEFNGACGALARNLLIKNAATGVRWHNETSGSFTEFCTLEGVEIANSVTLPFEYKITSGNNSFHGSGPGGGTENVVQRGGSPSTVLQADGTGTFIYNSPFNVQVFSTAADCTIFQNNNSVAPIPISFTGVLSIETSSARIITLGAGAGVWFSGSVKLIGATNLTGDSVVGGTFLRVDTISGHGDSSMSFSGAKKGSKITLTVPAASMAAINVSTLLNSVCRLVDFNLFASNYTKRFLLLLDFFGDGSTLITPITVGQHGSFDAPGGSLGYQQNTFSGSGNGSFNLVVPTVAKTASGAFSGGETSCTFSNSWQSPAGTYNWQFSNGDVRAVTIASIGATTATWTGGLSGAATTAITAQTWPNGSGTFSAYIMETQMSNGIQSSGHMQF